MPVVNPNDSFILLSKLILILVQYLVFNSVHIHNDFVKCNLLLNISDHNLLSLTMYIVDLKHKNGTLGNHYFKLLVSVNNNNNIVM